MKHIALFGLLGAITAAPATAQSADDGVKIVALLINTSELSKSTEAEAKLEQRVTDAVKSLCGDFSADQIGDCRRNARTQFNARIVEMRGPPASQLSSRK